QPAHRSSHAADNVLADSAGNVRVVTVGIDSQGLIGPLSRLFGVMQRGKIPVFDQRRVVALQTVDKGQSKESVSIARILGQTCLRDRLGFLNGSIEASPDGRISFGLRAVFKSLEELRLQHSQPIEFRKKQ